ncbi:MAG: hypothetical protein LBI69_01630 [Puniceicoccales bacterium]|jgi:hypothetical protein|nr:hypothetical protein [Puniceicoccales bacterium]
MNTNNNLGNNRNYPTNTNPVSGQGFPNANPPIPGPNPVNPNEAQDEDWPEVDAHAGIPGPNPMDPYEVWVNIVRILNARFHDVIARRTPPQRLQRFNPDDFPEVDIRVVPPRRLQRFNPDDFPEVNIRVHRNEDIPNPNLPDPNEGRNAF